MTAPKPLQLQFQRLAVRELELRTLERQNPKTQESQPSQVPVRLEVTIGVYLTENGQQSEVRFEVTLTPDARWQPYRIRVVLSGFFATPEEGRGAELGEFSQRAAPNILWPFVRDTVYRITGDGMYGPLLLDPTYVGQMIPAATGAGVTVGGSVEELKGPVENG